MKTKLIFLILFLIFIFILIIFLKNRSQKSEQIQPVKQYTPIANTQTSSFKLISTNIPETSMSITGSILLTFNQPISENLIFTIEPKAVVQSGLGTSSYEFVIAPKDVWAFDTTYTLTVSKSNLSQNNQSLDKNYLYTFKTPPFSGI